MIKITTKKIFSLLILICLNSCIGQKEIHGNLPEAQLVSLLKIGKDTKKTVSQILGQPTFFGASHTEIIVSDKVLEFLK